MRGPMAVDRYVARGFVVIAALAVFARGTALPAQSLSSSAVSNFRASSPDSLPARDHRQMRRLYPAATYGLAGALAFGFVGYLLAGTPCLRGCDFLGRNHIIGGAVAGEILGSTYGASRPRGRGRCTREERIGMALGGAFLGAIATAGVAQNPPGRISLLAVIPLGSVMFLKGC